MGEWIEGVLVTSPSEEEIMSFPLFDEECLKGNYENDKEIAIILCDHHRTDKDIYDVLMGQFGEDGGYDDNSETLLCGVTIEEARKRFFEKLVEICNENRKIHPGPSI